MSPTTFQPCPIGSVCVSLSAAEERHLSLDLLCLGQDGRLLRSPAKYYTHKRVFSSIVPHPEAPPCACPERRWGQSWELNDQIPGKVPCGEARRRAFVWLSVCLCLCICVFVSMFVHLWVFVDDFVYVYVCLLMYWSCVSDCVSGCMFAYRRYWCVRLYMYVCVSLRVRLWVGFRVFVVCVCVRVCACE